MRHTPIRVLSGPLFPLLLSSALAAVGSRSLAQETPGPRPVEPVDRAEHQRKLREAHTGFQHFSARAGGAWLARFDESTGAPDFIVGSGFEVGVGRITSIEDARVRAREVLARFPLLWGCELEQLTLESEVHVAQVYGFTWQQMHDGLVVRGARVQVQLHEVGRAVAFVARGVAIPPDFERTPVLTAEEAQAVVRSGKRVSSLDTIEARDLLIFVKGNGGVAVPVPAYRVDVEQPDLEVFERVYVDGRTGEILEVEPAIYHFGEVKGQVTGYVNAGLAGNTTPTLQPIPHCTVSIAGVGTTTTDADGNYSVQTAAMGPFNVSATLTGPYYAVSAAQGSNLVASGTTANNGHGVEVADLVFNAPPVEFGTSQTTGARELVKIRSYAQSRIPTFGGYPSQQVNVNIANTCNATFNPASNAINFYASGGGCNNSAYSTVLYHEYGHGVDDYFGGIASSSLSEALGDIFAMYMSGQPLIGANFYTSGSAIRTGENNTTWPASSCNGQVHCVGQTFMGFAWQLHKKLRASLGEAAGTQQAEKIVLGTLPFNNTSILNAVNQVFILDDDNGDLSDGTPNYADLAAAAIQKGFTPPAITILPITVDHVPHPDTWNQTKPYRIFTTLTPKDPEVVTAAFVDYEVEGGATGTVPLTPTGKPNEYAASIPPVVGPALVSYWIRAEDSANQSVQVPPAASAFRFAVGRKTRLFFDDLDSGAPGWTSVQVLTQNDWNLGKPQSVGTNAYDPKTAYSGSACWGNDLQLNSNQDGLYRQNSENYLDSPAINAAGYTGVRLRYRRWLTVEARQYDQATLFVNDTIVYTNPQSVDLVDTAWTLQDIAAPAADGVSSFKVRWRLKTNPSKNLGGWNLDDVEVYALEPTPVVQIDLSVNKTNPAIGNLLMFTFHGTPGASFELYASLDPGPMSLEGAGVVELGAESLGYFYGGDLDATGSHVLPIVLPFAPSLVGLDLYWCAAAGIPGSLPQISNALKTTFAPF